MLTVLPLRYFVIISLSAHLAALTLFGFTFRPLPLSNSPVISYGGRLPVPLSYEREVAPDGKRTAALIEPGLIPDNAGAPPAVLPAVARKPSAAYQWGGEKPVYAIAAAPAVFETQKDSTIIIHPLLPYELQLYFKDRQSVHLELAFSLVGTGRRKSIIIKRRISSGNLDADLLCCRYLGHYLFIQQARFAPNSWQTVKIDLSQ